MYENCVMIKIKLGDRRKVVQLLYCSSIPGIRIILRDTEKGKGGKGNYLKAEADKQQMLRAKKYILTITCL